MLTRRGAMLGAAALAVRRSEVSVGATARLDFVLQLPASSTDFLRAMLNGVSWCPGMGTKVTWDARGKIYTFTTTSYKTLLNVALHRPGLYLFDDGKDARSGGVRGFAEHPDYADPAKPGFGKVYITTLELPGVRSCPVLSGPYPSTFHAMLLEVDMHTGVWREVLCVTMFSRYHPMDTVVFGPTGNRYCYLCVGDGGYLTTQLDGDPYHQAQDTSSPLGKILRINPLQNGNNSYSIPTGNPGFAQPEVWCYGLRHPEHLFFAQDGSGGYLTDIGVQHWEKVYALEGGANYGWSNTEAGNGPSPALARWDRSAYSPAALCGGPVLIDGLLAGNVLFGDMVTGRIFYTAANQNGAFQPVYELQLEVPLLQLTGGTRCDMRLGTGSTSTLVTTKKDGVVRRLVFT